MQVSFFVNHRCNLRADKRFLHFFAHPRLAENGGISPKIATGALDSYVRQQYNVQRCAGRRHFILYYFFVGASKSAKMQRPRCQSGGDGGREMHEGVS